jgi:ATP-dependent Clp protease ATP-binding subunit ClpC
MGADLIKGGGGFGFGKRSAEINYENIKSIIQKEIERFFRPEFINRLDDVIVFHPLTKDDLVQIIEYETAKLGKRLAQQAMSIELDQAAKDFLIEKGYNPDFGARPLRRAIGQFLEDPLSEMLLGGDLVGKSKITVTRKNDAEGKPAEHLFFDMQDAPAEQKPVKAGPERAGSGELAAGST